MLQPSYMQTLLVGAERDLHLLRLESVGDPAVEAAGRDPARREFFKTDQAEEGF